MVSGASGRVGLKEQWAECQEMGGSSPKQEPWTPGWVAHPPGPDSSVETPDRKWPLHGLGSAEQRVLIGWWSLTRHAASPLGESLHVLLIKALEVLKERLQLNFSQPSLPQAHLILHARRIYQAPALCQALEEPGSRQGTIHTEMPSHKGRNSLVEDTPHTK